MLVLPIHNINSVTYVIARYEYSSNSYCAITTVFKYKASAIKRYKELCSIFNKRKHLHIDDGMDLPVLIEITNNYNVIEEMKQ